MVSPDVTNLILDCQGKLNETRNLLIEAENNEGAELQSPTTDRYEKSLAIVMETIFRIKDRQNSSPTTLQDKMQLVEIRDSASSLAFLIHIAKDDIESAANLSDSIQLSKLEFPTLSIALKAIPFFIDRNELNWPWDALVNIIKQFNTEVFEEAQKSNPFDLWLLVLFSGFLSKNEAKVKSACERLSSHEHRELNKIVCFASALESRSMGRILWNAHAEQLEYYWKNGDALKAIANNPESYAVWTKSCEAFLIIRKESGVENIHSPPTIADGWPGETRTQMAETRIIPAPDPRLRGMRGVPGLPLNDVRDMLNNESALMRGLGMSIVEAGGPEALMRWADEMRATHPEMRGLLDGPRQSPFRCPQCIAIIEQQVRKYSSGLLTSKTLVCPSCGTKLSFNFTSTTQSRRDIPPRGDSYESVGDELLLVCKIIFFIVLFIISIPLGIISVIVYFRFWKSSSN